MKGIWEWQKRWYGKESTSAQIAVVNSVILGSLLFFYAFWVDFIPSIMWSRWGFFVSGLLTALTCVAIYRGFTSTKLKSYPMSRSKWWASFAVLGFVLFGLFWFSVVHAVPHMLTRLFGQDSEIMTSLQGKSRRGSRLCNFQLVGDTLARAEPSYLCISEAAFPGDGARISVRLEGQVTSLGFSITHVHRNQER